MLEPGHCCSGYRFEEQVGTNAICTLWRATDLRRGSLRGIRVLAPEAKALQAEFVASSVIQRTVNHPNRVRLLDFFELDGVPALVTEHVSGPSLATWMRIRSRSPDEVLAVFQDIVAGVAAAHELDLWHLQFDPSQIWMHTRRGSFVPKVDLAFGPMVSAGLRLGRIRAPEQTRGQVVDGRADVFLLGALLYELLGGRIPDDPTPRRPLGEVRPELPRPLATFVDRVLAPDPKDRPQSVEHLAQILTHAADAIAAEPTAATGRQHELRPALAPARPWKHPLAVASMVAVALSLAGALYALGG